MLLLLNNSTRKRSTFICGSLHLTKCFFSPSVQKFHSLSILFSFCIAALYTFTNLCSSFLALQCSMYLPAAMESLSITFSLLFAPLWKWQTADATAQLISFEPRCLNRKQLCDWQPSSLRFPGFRCHHKDYTRPPNWTLILPSHLYFPSS